MNMRHLKLNGDLGQVVPIPIDFVDEDSIRLSLKSSNVVINCIGQDVETTNYNFHDANVKVVYRLTKLAKESGLVKKFIHVSALGADVDSPSAFLRSKAEGEQVVREFFPNATIIRPAPIFGEEDRFVNTIAKTVNMVPMEPMVNADQRLQPVFVTDVAQAIVNCLLHEGAPGNIVYACGPDIVTREELVEYVCDAIYRYDYWMLKCPHKIARVIGQVMDKFPAKWRVVTADGVDQQSVDFVEPVLRGALDLKALQINPRSINQESSKVLLRHRGNRRKPIDAVNIN